MCICVSSLRLNPRTQFLILFRFSSLTSHLVGGLNVPSNYKSSKNPLTTEELFFTRQGAGADIRFLYKSVVHIISSIVILDNAGDGLSVVTDKSATKLKCGKSVDPKKFACPTRWTTSSICIPLVGGGTLRVYAAAANGRSTVTMDNFYAKYPYNRFLDSLYRLASRKDDAAPPKVIMRDRDIFYDKLDEEEGTRNYYESGKNPSDVFNRVVPVSQGVAIFQRLNDFTAWKAKHWRENEQE